VWLLKGETDQREERGRVEEGRINMGWLGVSLAFDVSFPSCCFGLVEIFLHGEIENANGCD